MLQAGKAETGTKGTKLVDKQVDEQKQRKQKDGKGSEDGRDAGGEAGGGVGQSGPKVSHGESAPPPLNPCSIHLTHVACQMPFVVSQRYPAIISAPIGCHMLHVSQI